jgi:cell division protein FtsW
MGRAATMSTRVERRELRAAPFQRELDWLMLAVVCLCCVGLVMAVSVQSLREDSNALLAMKSQGAKLVAGLVLLLVTASLPLDLLRRRSLLLFGAGAAAVFAAAFLGPDWNGARRWLSIGGVSFQPIEFARLAMIVFTAALLGHAGDRVHQFRRGLLATMLPAVVLAVGLMLQPDHGNALLCLTLAVGIGLVAGVRTRWFVIGALPLIPLIAFLVASRGYAAGRITSFLSSTPGYQVSQSLLAIQTGGMTGHGIGAGWMKLGFVPEAQSDFVFAIVGEELGFIGAFGVLACFAVICFVGCRLVMQVRDPFCRYVICGCAMAITAQALVNMLVTTGMAPAKGIDLPFVSSGGTNLMTSLGAVGLIGNAARHDLSLSARDASKATGSRGPASSRRAARMLGLPAARQAEGAVESISEQPLSGPRSLRRGGNRGPEHAPRRRRSE